MVSNYSEHRARFRANGCAVEYWTKIEDNKVFVKGKKFFGLISTWRFLCPYIPDLFDNFKDIRILDDETFEETGTFIREYPLDVKNFLRQDKSLIDPDKELLLENYKAAEKLSNGRLRSIEKLMLEINNESLYNRELKEKASLLKDLNPNPFFQNNNDKKKSVSKGVSN